MQAAYAARCPAVNRRRYGLTADTLGLVSDERPRILVTDRPIADETLRGLVAAWFGDI
jgi:hypothetical protein